MTSEITATSPLTARLSVLRDSSELLWDAAVDSAESEGDAKRQERAEAASSEAADLWESAIDYADAGAFSRARESVESARHLAAEWDDDGIERDGLRMIDAAVESQAAKSVAAEMTRCGLSPEAAETEPGIVTVSVDGWPDPVRFRAEAALEVLRRQDDGSMATEAGDARVCTALEAAGAYIRTGAPDPGEWGVQD